MNDVAARRRAYDRKRSHRHRAVRAKVVSLKVRLPVVAEAGGVDTERPRTRGDCEAGPRPCPYVSCKYHLYLDVTDAGSVKLNFPDLEPDELEHSCALDFADRGGATLEDVGQVMNLTRERVRQVELRMHTRLAVGLRAFDEEGPEEKRFRRYTETANRPAPSPPPADDEPEATDDEEDNDDGDALSARVWRAYERLSQRKKDGQMGELTTEQREAIDALREMNAAGTKVNFAQLADHLNITREAAKARLEPLRGSLVEWPRRGTGGIVLLGEHGSVASVPKREKRPETDDVVVSLTAVRKKHEAKLAALEESARQIAEQAAAHTRQISRIDVALAAFDAGTDLASTA